MASAKQKLQNAAAEVEKARAAFQDAQRRFDELFKQITDGIKLKRGKATTIVALDSPKTEPSKRAVDKIEAVLLEDRSKQFSYEQIASKSKVPVPSLKTLIYRLKKDGKAERVGRGLWQATQMKLSNTS